MWQERRSPHLGEGGCVLGLGQHTGEEVVIFGVVVLLQAHQASLPLVGAVGIVD